MYKKIIIIGAILTLIGCNSSKSVIITSKSRSPKSTKTTPLPKKESRLEENKSKSKTIATSDVVNGYISDYKDIAMSNMRNFGIPASIILAQGILESGAGQSNLAVTANNHFGIKCYKDWTGANAYQDDDTSQECFRKYKNSEESYQDHADIVSKRTRYASLFNLPKGDYKGWAKGLKAAGYATDPNYPEKLINSIEQYHLDQYDNQVLGKDYVLDKKENMTPKTNQYIEEIKKQNNIVDNAISIGQNLKIQ